jgi:NAD(P)H-flavin reductase
MPNDTIPIKLPENTPSQRDAARAAPCFIVAGGNGQPPLKEVILPCVRPVSAFATSFPQAK